VIPWERLARVDAPDGTPIELRRRGHEYVIYSGGTDLMSSEDVDSSRALADLGCAHLDRGGQPRVLVGGLGMGYTLRAALDRTGPRAVVEIAELVPAVVEWNRDLLADLAGRPLEDSRVELHVGDVGELIRAARGRYDAVLLDVDNGPHAHAHAVNDRLYGRRGLQQAWNALRPGGALAVWSVADDRSFTVRLRQQGFDVALHRVTRTHKQRGRVHWVWVAAR